jgi:hypothetical protein
MGLDSVVLIATRYRVEGRGIKSRWGQIFRTLLDGPRGPPDILYEHHGYQASYPGVQRPERVFYYPTSTSAKVSERVGLISTPPLGLHSLFYGELYLT